MGLNKDNILTILSSQKPFLEKEFSVIQLGLFGSYLHDQQTAQSDIDIAFEVDPSKAFTLEKKTALEEYLRTLFNKDVDLVRLKYINPVIRFTMGHEVIYV